MNHKTDNLQEDAIDLATLNVAVLFRKYFVPTLLGMLSISAVTAVDGIFVGHGVGADGIAAINLFVPLLMVFTGIGLMAGMGCSVVASIHLAKDKGKVARLGNLDVARDFGLSVFRKSKVTDRGRTAVFQNGR